MPRIHIVTDGGATFSNPRLIRHFPLTVLSNQIEMDGELLEEEPELDREAAFRRIARLKKAPRVIPPSESAYAELFNKLSRYCDVVISIHPSRELSESWRNGRQAAQQIDDRCEIAVVDSGSVCAGQGMLVRAAARAVHDKLGADEAIQTVRQAANRVYSLYCVGSLNFLGHNSILSPAHAILARRLKLKPFVSIEDGKIVVVGKVQRRMQAIERLVEFLVEFEMLEDVVMLQPQLPISNDTRLLHERLGVEFPGQHFPFTIYSATMAAWLGPEAIGVSVMEKEADEPDDDC